MLGASGRPKAYSRTDASADSVATRYGSHPYAGPVGGNEKWSDPGAGFLAQLPQEPLEPADFVARITHVGVPHHQAQVVPSQWVPDGRRGRIHVDRFVGRKNFTNSHGAQTVLILQPTFAFIFIDDDNLLGDRIDVLKQRGGNRFEDRVSRRVGDIDRAHFGEYELVHHVLAEAIRAYQGIERNPVLGQASGELHGRRAPQRAPPGSRNAGRAAGCRRFPRRLVRAAP